MNWDRYFQLALKGALYVIALINSIPIFTSVSKSMLETFLSSSVSFNLDTIYLNWNTSFPAVTVCELYNGEKIWDLTHSEFGTEHDLFLDDFIGEVVFFRGLCTSCELCDKFHCPDNFTGLLDAFRTKCDELISDCTYLNELFECCDEFLPIHTEYGLCYSFNSQQARKEPHTHYTNTRTTGAGHLSFLAATDIQLYVHAPIDVPFLFSDSMIRETVLLGSFKEIILNVIEVYNHESALDLTMEQRRCRLSHEMDDNSRKYGIYKFYSYSGCVVQCSVDLQLMHCNCTSPYMAIPDSNSLPMCNAHGLMCLTEVTHKYAEQRRACASSCMSSCDEPEYNIIYNSADTTDEDSEEDVSLIRVALVELPTQRYVRRVAKTNLDLLISVGGLIGLFFNTSALRIVEFVFLCVKRPTEVLQFLGLR